MEKKQKVTCFWCEVGMIQLPEEENSWKCPDCGGVWTYTDDPRGNSIVMAWKDEQRYKRSISAPGGNKSSGRKRDKDKKVGDGLRRPWEMI